MTRVIAEYHPQQHPPLLRLYIFHAPHRRMHIRVITAYRASLRMALMKIGVEFPIENHIDLDVTFINPSSPDLGNLYLALEQAMDGQTLAGPGIVTDDSLISRVSMRKLFTAQREQAKQPVNLPRFTPMPAAEQVA